MTYRYMHAHSCRPFLHEAMDDMEEIVYGSVTQCPSCRRCWIILPYRPWPRRTIKAYDEAGWWVQETRAQGRRRLDKIAQKAALDAEFQEIVSRL